MFGEGGNKSRNLCVDTVTQQWERSLVLTKGQSNAIYQTRETCEPLSFLCLSLLDRATFVAPFSRRCKPAVEPLISRCHDRLSTGTSDIPRPHSIVENFPRIRFQLWQGGREISRRISPTIERNPSIFIEISETEYVQSSCSSLEEGVRRSTRAFLLSSYFPLLS